jgi:hypothetical protein
MTLTLEANQDAIVFVMQFIHMAICVYDNIAVSAEANGSDGTNIVAQCTDGVLFLLCTSDAVGVSENTASNGRMIVE